nr:transposon protein, putative, CACTA, En/Spm sub-class [Triticum aestivum]
MVWKQVWRRKKQATTLIKQWRKDTVMMAPVTEWRRTKDTMMTAPVTERSPASPPDRAPRRDMIPISIEQCLKPKDKDSQVSYVSGRQKAELWTALQANFTIPPEEDPENPVKKPMMKANALKKMTPEKLPYERTPEENTKIVRAEVTNLFEGVKAKKHPPPEEKVDLVKAKRTLAALTKPPKSPPKGNYERIIGKSFAKAEWSGSTVSDKSDIVANDPRMVPGYTNLGDYQSNDVHYDFLKVDEHRYEYGKPLVKDEGSLTTMMRRFHDWYMKTCRESGGRNILTLRVKEEHDLVGIELLNVPFEEFLEFFNQKALDKFMVTCYCLLKIAELKKRQIGDIGFINTNLIDAYTVEKHANDTEANLLRSLVINQNKDIILFPYNFKFHYILLEIKLEQGLVTVLDSRRKDPQEYANMNEMLEKVWKKFTSKAPGLSKKLQFEHLKKKISYHGGAGDEICAGDRDVTDR